MGIGLLIINNELIKGYQLDGQIAGSQHNGLRGGTENVPAIASAYEALRCAFEDRAAKNKKLEQMRQHIINTLAAEFKQIEYKECFGTLPDFAFVVIGPANPLHRVPNTLFVSFVDKHLKFCNGKLKKAVGDRGAIISIGSACNTDSDKASHVMTAIRAPRAVKKGVVRVSMGDTNTMGEIKRFAKILIECVKLQR
mgnify:CR=1 FL=1